MSRITRSWRYIFASKTVVAEFCFANIKSDLKYLLLNKVAGVWTNDISIQQYANSMSSFSVDVDNFFLEATSQVVESMIWNNEVDSRQSHIQSLVNVFLAERSEKGTEKIQIYCNGYSGSLKSPSYFPNNLCPISGLSDPAMHFPFSWMVRFKLCIWQVGWGGAVSQS